MLPTASEIDRHVGQRLRHRRESLGLSQGALARHLGLTFSQVQKYEKGVNRIGAGRLYLLAEMLGVPVSYFFETLPAEQAAATPAPECPQPDTAELLQAYLSIGDVDVRQSVVALVRSLAESGAVRRPVAAPDGRCSAGR